MTAPVLSCWTSSFSEPEVSGVQRPHAFANVSAPCLNRQTTLGELLLRLFPDARFFNIHRNPYDVFRSERHTIRVAQPLYHLREGPVLDGDDQIISVYTEMYDAYFEKRNLIPKGRFYDVGYEDLGREPVAVVRSIHEPLGLSEFEELRPRLESYLASIVGYRQNRHDELPESLRRSIANDWGRSFDEWGYGR
jgi:omega-hydroxy-beta-dihydromenaquinone-9 sulfotransferase